VPLRILVALPLFLIVVVSTACGGKQPASSPASEPAPASSTSAAVEPTLADDDYLLLATSSTATMQDELNAAADRGYELLETTTTGGGIGEIIAILQRTPEDAPGFEYWVLATIRTSTMEQELRQAGLAGFAYQDHVDHRKENVIFLSRSRDPEKIAPVEYALLATNKTSTMQSELRRALGAGFRFHGVTVNNGLSGGKEVVIILSRPGA
tara:strand:+ start:7038 stop:7667 length:630 start_codon:yes stop_codon:yes gene_type:complete